MGGLFAYRVLNIEAYPDPVPPLVDIVTQNPGQSSEEIERYITIPIEVQMAGLPNVQTIRSISLFGLSDVKVQFTYDLTYQQASQLVINRLSQLGPLPNGAQPSISPVSPIGEIFRYRVVGPPGYSVADLKTIQDWILQRRFKAIPGVIDVTGWGGKTKTYDITIDLDRLLAYGLTLKQVLDGLNNANINVGANTVNIGHAVGDRAQRRPDPHHGRHPQHHADGARRRASAGVRRRHRDRGQPAAARHRRARATTTTSSRASC